MMKKNGVLLLGHKIKHIRTEKGISQENMARAIKSSKSFVQRLEVGQTECSSDMLTKIKNFLEIENAPLLEDEVEMFKDRIWVWNGLLDANRAADAREMRSEMAPILDLPFEQELFVLFKMIDIKLLTKEMNLSDAEEKLNEVEPLLESASDEALFIYHTTKGFVDAILKREYRSAVKHYLQTLNIVSDYVKPDATVLSNLGVIYLGLCKPCHAIIYLERVLGEYDIDRTHLDKPKATAMLATAYMYLGEYKKAKELFETALVLAKSIKHEVLTGVILVNMSYLNFYTGNYKQAVELCQEGAKYVNDNDSKCMTFYKKGICHYKLKEFDECKKAIEHGRALSNGDKRLSIFFNSLEHLINLNDNNSATYIEETAIPFFSTCDNIDKFVALELCRELEAHYMKKRAKTRAWAIAAIARDVYEDIFMKEIDI